jgi:hypothetical protein
MQEEAAGVRVFCRVSYGPEKNGLESNYTKLTLVER